MKKENIEDVVELTLKHNVSYAFNWGVTAFLILAAVQNFWIIAILLHN